MKNSLLWICLLLMMAGCNKQSPKTTGVPTPDSSGIVVDPLPSWNDGQTKNAIIAFVTRVTDRDHSDYIPPEDRIATFDNDGTLWSEKPYVQELFAFYRVQKMVAAKPELAKQQPFKAVVEHDKSYFEKGGDKALIELVAVTHTGMTEDEFEKETIEFYSSSTYPGLNVPFSRIVYQPQLEVLEYLRDNGFRTFICTGGTIEFVRAISEDYYGIPSEQVIGTSFQYEFNDSTNILIRKSALGSFNDKTAKPVNIQLHIGKRPVFACGNEGGAGDIAMLEFCQSNSYPSFQMLINHNDSIREFYYQEADNASLNAAEKNKWHVVSMKDDWKNIFPE